jgi:hypothetical protein
VACSAQSFNEPGAASIRFGMYGGEYYYVQADAAFGQAGRLELNWNFLPVISLRSPPVVTNGVFHVGYRIFPGTYDAYVSSDLGQWIHLMQTNVTSTELDYQSTLPSTTPLNFFRIRRLTSFGPSGDTR